MSEGGGAALPHKPVTSYGSRKPQGRESFHKIKLQCSRFLYKLTILKRTWNHKDMDYQSLLKRTRGSELGTDVTPQDQDRMSQAGSAPALPTCSRPCGEDSQGLPRRPHSPWVRLGPLA